MKNTIKRIIFPLLTVATLLFSLFMSACAPTTVTPPPNKVADNLVIYPEFDEKIQRDYTYSVTVTQGDKSATLPVYNHVSPLLESRGEHFDLYRRFATFAFEGSRVRVDIEVKQDFETYSVMPSVKAFENEYDNGVISVYLDEPDYFLVRLDGDDNSLISIFADEPESEDYVDETAENVIKVDGWYAPQMRAYTYLENPKLNTYATKELVWPITQDNTTIYIAPGAVLYARVFVAAKNVKIIGHGAIVDPFGDNYNYDARQGLGEGSGSRLLHLWGENAKVDGIHLLNAHCFNIGIDLYASNTKITNTKTLSSMMTSDGFSYGGADNVELEHCYVYNADNGITFGRATRTDVCDLKATDMTLGTTCAALFPQGGVHDSYFKDIHVFRANEGVINNYFTWSTELDKPVTFEVENIDAVDCVELPHFFKGQNMGVSLKTVNVKNVLLGANAQKFYELPASTTNGAGDNYVFNISNVVIDGTLIESDSELVKNQANGLNNTFNYSCDEATAPEYVDGTMYADYALENKIFIGEQQIFFKNKIITDGGIFLPYEQIKSELRTTATATTTTIDGVKYVDVNNLVSSGMAKAKSVDVAKGKIVLTPNYNGENLLTPDDGILSQIWEAKNWDSDTYTSKEGNTLVYNFWNRDMASGAGFGRDFSEEFKKYGKGTYKLSFYAKSDVATALDVSAVFAKNVGVTAGGAISVTTAYQLFEVTLDLSSCRTDYIGFQFIQNAKPSTATTVSVKEVKLVKVA